MEPLENHKNQLGMDPMMDSMFTDTAKQCVNDPAKWRDCAPDHQPCAVCKKMIFSMPLLLWLGEQKTKIMAFHSWCAFKEPWDEDLADEEKAVEYGTCYCIVCPQLRGCAHVHESDRTRFIKMNEDMITGDANNI